MLFDSVPSPTAIAVVIIGGLVYLASTKWTLSRSHQIFQRENGCTPACNVYKLRDRFVGLDLALAMREAAKQKKLLNWFSDTHKVFGSTYLVRTWRVTTIHTTESENAKAAFAENFHDWSVGPARQAFKSFLGRSTFMVDGAEWSHSRALLRPIFAKDSIADLDLLEEHFQVLLKLLPNDGSTVNLADLFNRYSFDVSSEFLFGESVGTLRNQTPDKARLAQDIELAIQDAADRARYSWLYPLLKRKGVPEALANVRTATEKYVHAAMARAINEKKTTTAAENHMARYSFLDEIARQSQDLDRMRDEATTLMFAGKDTSATLLGNLWFFLVKHPQVWAKLLAEVDQLQGAPPTYEWIKSARYLRHCEHEAMRLYPVTPILPPRVANKDTVVPLGGGANGNSPMFVAKGTRLVINIYCANRRKDVFGEDADEFNPDRWEGLRPGWHYIPFSGGPRICIGQQFALTEVYYLTVRLMQHFRRAESRDPNPFVESFTGVTVGSDNGVQVGLFSE